jgi:hypothetical protein
MRPGAGRGASHVRFPAASDVADGHVRVLVRQTGAMQPIDEPGLSAELIRARADAVMQRLRSAAEAAGRAPDAFRLVAVTKGFGVDVVTAAVEAGLHSLGENRVQEAAVKVEAVPGIEWHLVGHLQSNKVRAALGLFQLIHSVDSVELLRRIDRIAGEEGKRPDLLLQVNVAGEQSKAGFDPELIRPGGDAHAELADACRNASAARLTGLMTIGPAGIGADEQRSLFARLRDLRDQLALSLDRPLPELSMGMTADADAAVAEGATMVRIGTAIFGPRPHH